MTHDNSLHAFQKGVGAPISGGIPPQAIPDAKKTKKWLRTTMDSLEREAERQWLENQKFQDYYDMVAGHCTHTGTDFQDIPEFLDDIKQLREDAGIPTWIKHYDTIGMTVNVLAGIYSDFKDIYRVDSIDEYSSNEFIREKTARLQEFATQSFQLELTKMLVMRGIDPQKQEFISEEDQQAYLQQVEGERQKLVPPQEEELRKDFRVIATEWAENTLEGDQKRFLLDEMEREEFIDYLITGRYFRHYKVGYDNYKPERWHPREVFFSKDVEAKYPQDGEYVGRLRFLSPSDIINNYGHMLTAREQEAISNYYNQNEVYDTTSGEGSSDIAEQIFGQEQIVPFENYYEHDLLLKYQDALGEPLGVREIDGKKFKDFLPELENGNASFIGHRNARNLRKDFVVRDDVIQVTEGYWRSYKRIGLLNYNDENGVFRSIVVTDDLLAGFLTENEIKRLRNVSLDEFERAKRENRMHEYVNTIIYTYNPEIRRFAKIKNNSDKLKEDIYLYGEALDFQIKGESNIYDFKLPVAGIITDSTVLRLAPYQVMHNICMNQVYNLLEKEIGIFFLMDVNYLPSEFMEGGDHESAIWKLREFAKDVGFMPVDLSRQNLQGQQPFNSFIRQDITFGTQIEYRMALAERYKQDGLQQIGITPQLLGAPNKYMTAEGVQQGAQASQAQLLPIFEKIGTAKLRMMDLHLAVAQYCQSNNKDTSVFYRGSDGAHHFLNIMAEDGDTFPLRRLGVVAVSSAKDRKVMESIKQVFANNNTITNDVADVASIFTSDTITELISVARSSRTRIQQQSDQEKQFQAEQVDKQIAANQQAQAAEQEYRANEAELDRQSKETIAYINKTGELYDTSNPDAVQTYKINSQNELTRQRNINDALLKDKDLNIKEADSQKGWDAKMKGFELEMEKLKVKREDIASRNYTSTINKN